MQLLQFIVRQTLNRTYLIYLIMITKKRKGGKEVELSLLVSHNTVLLYLAINDVQWGTHPPSKAGEHDFLGASLVGLKTLFGRKMFPIDDFTVCWNILINWGGVRRTDEGRESWEYPGKAWTSEQALSQVLAPC